MLTTFEVHKLDMSTIFPMLLGIELPGLAAASSPLGQRSHTAKGSAVLILPDRRTATPTALSSIFTE